MRVCLFDGYMRNRTQLSEELSVASAEPQKLEHAILEAGFERWGCDIGKHIHGSFALAILDEESGEVFCARDPLGIVPFYYCLDSDGAFRYGSDIAHVAGGGRARAGIDREALQRYLMFGYPADEKTLYEGVRKLMPGHYLLFDGENILIKPYFTLSFVPDFSRCEEQWACDIERVLEGVLA